MALANLMKVHDIASAGVKTDKADAMILAPLLRADLVAKSHVPLGDVREKRALVRHRLSLMKMHTMVKNKMYAITDKYGLYCQKINAYLIEH